MSIATLSDEAQILNRLKRLHCSVNQFGRYAAPIVGTVKLIGGLNGTGSRQRLSHMETQKLLGLVNEMESLETSVGVPVDWGRFELVACALLVRRIGREIDAE